MSVYDLKTSINNILRKFHIEASLSEAVRKITWIISSQKLNEKKYNLSLF